MTTEEHRRLDALVGTRAQQTRRSWWVRSADGRQHPIPPDHATAAHLFALAQRLRARTDSKTPPAPESD